MLPAEYRELVLPAPIDLTKRPSSRYIPRFDSERNTCWWEWFPTRQERKSDGWEEPKRGRRSHQRRRERMAKKDEETAHDGERIVGEESFLDEDLTFGATGAVVDDELEEAQSEAWTRLGQENRKRAEMAAAWMNTK